MSIPEVNTTPDTDDLDAFSDLFAGRVKATEPEVEEAAEDEPLATEPEQEDVVEPEVDAEPEDKEEDETLLKVKPKQTAKERIKELVAKNHEAERREADLARKLEEVLARLDKPVEKEVKVTATDTPDPDQANEDGSPKYPLGEFDPKYIADLTRHTIRKEAEEFKNQEKAAAEAQKAQAQKESLQAAWADKVTSAEERLPDLREKGQALESAFAGIDPTYGEYLASTIMSMEYGPDVLYYLSNNTAEARKIAASGPTQATISLGRIEARFAIHEEEKKKLKVSSAPTPPPLNTKGTKAAREIPDDTDDLDAFSDKFFVKRR